MQTKHTDSRGVGLFRDESSSRGTFFVAPCMRERTGQRTVVETILNTATLYV